MPQRNMAEINLPLFEIELTDGESMKYHYLCPVTGKPMPGAILNLPAPGSGASVTIGPITMSCNLCGQTHTFGLQNLTLVEPITEA